MGKRAGAKEKRDKFSYEFQHEVNESTRKSN